MITITVINSSGLEPKDYANGEAAYNEVINFMRKEDLWLWADGKPVAEENITTDLLDQADELILMHGLAGG